MAKKELENTSIKDAKESEEKTKRDKYATDATEETKRLKYEKDVEERIKENEAKNKVTLKQLDVEVKKSQNEKEAKANDLRIEEEKTKQIQVKEENQTKRAIEETKRVQAIEETKQVQAQGEVISLQIQMLNQIQVVMQTLETHPEERIKMFAALMSTIDQAKGRSCAPPIQEQFYEGLNKNEAQYHVSGHEWNQAWRDRKSNIENIVHKQ